MLKVRKYKVDEWVWYCPFVGSNVTEPPAYSLRAVILSICDQNDFHDYRIYIEETAKFKAVKEEDLFNMQK